MSIGERCKIARNELKISQKELADAVSRLGFKIGQSTIGNLEAGKVQSPRFLPELAQALGVTTEWLRKGSVTKSEQVRITQPAVRVAPIVAPYLNEMPRDVPVLGTAVGGNGQVVMRGEALDYVRRPPSLIGRTDVFALFVEDVSMQPAFSPGDLVFVERRRPRVGDHAIIEYQENARDEVRVVIKRLAAISGATIKLEQYNPQKLLEIKASTVVNMRRVMTMADLFVI